jgi:hypothetical protein
MAYSILGAVSFGQPIADVSTTQKVPLGRIVQAEDPTYGVGEFQYVKGVTNGAVGSWVTINSDDWTTTLLAANAIGPVGVMMSAIAASTSYGWVQINGKVAVAKCLTLFADNASVYITSTAGSVDDASVIGDEVFGAKGASTTTVSSGVAEFEIQYPFVANRVAPIG